MKLFLDTAIVSDIEERVSTGLIDGITTNPTLIKKSGRDPWTVYRDIVELGIEDLSIEVNGEDSKELVRNAMTVQENYGNVATIKLPCTIEGLKACKYLSNIGIRVNMTLVFSVSQAILCALAGAMYVSPFIGRMDDNSLDGMRLINDISNVFKKQFINTLILAASVRDAQSVGVAFGLGANICTIPPKVFDNMANHALTDKGLEQFNRDFLA
jgi:transaldolase